MIDAVAAVLAFEDQIFMIKRQNHLKAFPGYWAFPGGKVDAGDKADAHQLLSGHDLRLIGALLREVKEELGLDLKVAIDLNAVPPVGLGGLEVTDHAQVRNGILCYGAIGVGGMKMKIHKAAVKSLFEANDRVLDTEAIFAIGEGLKLK